MSIKAEGTESEEVINLANEDDEDTPPTESGNGAESESAESAGDEQLHVAFGTDPSPGSDDEDDDEIEVDGVKMPAPPWVKQTRKENRELNTRLKALETENARLKAPKEETPAVIVVGEFPTLEGCGFDETKFQAETRAWYDRQRQADAQAAELKKKDEDRKRAEQERGANYLKERAAIKAPDVEAVEKVALDKLTVLQQNYILSGCIKPALFVYALGKSPAKLAELAAITDPVKFVATAARFETELKTKMAKPGVKPESKLAGNASTTATGDKKLAQLRAEAEKTGDYTAVTKYKAEMRTRKKT